MPVYQFECGICDHKYEHLLEMSRRHEFVSCPKCGVYNRKGISAPNLKTEATEDVYWDGAERERLKNMNKNIGAEAEKAKYNDKEYHAKHESDINNSLRLGNEERARHLENKIAKL